MRIGTLIEWIFSIGVIALVIYGLFYVWSMFGKNHTENKTEVRPKDLSKQDPPVFKAHEVVKQPPVYHNDYLEIPDSVDEFSKEHFMALKLMKNHPVDVAFSGMWTAVVDMKQFETVALRLGLVKICESLLGFDSMTVNDLKDILRKNKLKVSGKKEELIARLQNELSEEQKKSYIQTVTRYELTEKGEEALHGFYIKREVISRNIFSESFKYIINRDFDSAYRLINAVRTENVSHDDNKQELEYNKRTLYTELFKELSNQYDSEMIACGIYADMSGESINRIEILYTATIALPEDSEKFKSNIRYIMSCLSSMYEILNYKDAEIEKYRFVATLDAKTCPVCVALNGKEFPVDKQKFGINCPPMHEGCRCTTVAVLDEEIMEGMQRRAVDPETGRDVFVPADMTYEEWKKKYL